MSLKRGALPGSNDAWQVSHNLPGQRNCSLDHRGLAAVKGQRDADNNHQLKVSD